MLALEYYLKTKNRNKQEVKSIRLIIDKIVEVACNQEIKIKNDIFKLAHKTIQRALKHGQKVKLGKQNKSLTYI